MICQTLASVENRLQRLEGIFELFFCFGEFDNSLQTGLSTLSEKSRIIEEKTNTVLEILCISVRSSKDIGGIKVDNEEIRLSLFADDLADDQVF